jgi:hypothetical protein
MNEQHWRSIPDVMVREHYILALGRVLLIEQYAHALFDISKTRCLAAPAWYFMFIVCHFFARRGEKMTHRELNIIDKRSCLHE